MDYKKAVKLALAGDEEGYKFLYDDTYKSKYYLAFQYMKNEEAANDVVQEAYIKAFARLGTLENPDAFSGWFGTIVANTAKNALVKKNPTLFSDIAVDAEGDSFEYQIEDESIESQPELSYTRQETQMLTRELIDSLSDEQRMCILMFHIEGEPISVIAQTLGCSENTVKSRLNYGRKNLKAKAEELKKKGVKLYGFAPLPLLVYLLKGEISASAATGAVATTGMATGAQTAAVKTSVATAVKSMPLVTKILIGAIAAVVIGGGAAITLAANSPKEPAPESRPEVIEPAEENEEDSAVKDDNLTTFVTPTLSGLAITTTGVAGEGTMDSLSFDYPNGWVAEITTEETKSEPYVTEDNYFSAKVTHPSGVVVGLSMLIGGIGENYIEDEAVLTKLADTNIENIGVYRKDVDYPASNYSEVFIAKISSGMVRTSAVIVDDNTIRGYIFDSNGNGFTIDREADLSTEVYQEAIAILASLRWTDPQEEAASATPQSAGATPQFSRAEQDWQSVYKQVLKEAPNQRHEQDGLFSNGSQIRYQIHDMDGDSVPELIVTAGLSPLNPADANFYTANAEWVGIYSYKNAGAELKGESIQIMAGYAIDKNTNNLIAYSVHPQSGSSSYYALSLTNGVFHEENIYNLSGKPGELDYIGSFNDEHGFVRLEFSDVNDLTLLSK